MKVTYKMEETGKKKRCYQIHRRIKSVFISLTILSMAVVLFHAYHERLAYQLPSLEERIASEEK